MLELERRREKKELKKLQIKGKAGEVFKSLFKKQKKLVRELMRPNATVAVLTSRRAGKSWSVVSTMILQSLLFPGSKCLFLSLTRINTKRFAWSTILKLNATFGLGINFQKTDLVAEFPNGSIIEFAGADNPKLPDRFLGADFDIIAIDEAGSFDPQVLNYLIVQVLEQTLMDRSGKMILVGTPKEIETGMFYEVTTKPSSWTVLTWNTGHNPYMRKQWLARMKKKIKFNKNIVKEPAFIRDYLGRWARDMSVLVYEYSDGNLIGELPSGVMSYVLSIDFGWNDATAFVLLGIRKYDKKLYVIDTYKKTHMFTDDVANQIMYYQERFQPIVIIGDPASKTTIEDISNRYQIPINSAVKTKKRDTIRSLNADLSSGNIKFLQAGSSLLIKELKELPKKINVVTGIWEEHPAFDNHLTDALLYGWRYSQTWNQEEAPRPIKDKIYEDLVKKIKKKNQNNWRR